MELNWGNREELLRKEKEELRDELLIRCARMGADLPFLMMTVRYLECVWQEAVNRNLYDQSVGIRECIAALQEVGETAHREGKHARSQ